MKLVAMTVICMRAPAAMLMKMVYVFSGFMKQIHEYNSPHVYIYIYIYIIQSI